MKYKHQKKHHPDNFINVTPFIDVVLVLLIIFMISAPMMIVGLKVDLPKGNEVIDDQERNNSIAISFDRSGLIVIEDIKTNAKDFLYTLKKISNNNKAKEILIHADRILQYGYIMEFIDLLKRNGYKNVVFVTKDEN